MCEEKGCTKQADEKHRFCPANTHMTQETRLYNSLSSHLRSTFGCKLFKVSINTGLSCPNRDGAKGKGGCAYCDSSTLLPKDFISGSRVREQLLSGIEYVRKRHKADSFIAYFQVNTNTHAPVEELKRLYEEALIPEVAAIAVSTRPDCLAEEVLDLLCELGSKKHLWIELGLQSANDSTLERINRGHTAAEFADACGRAAKRGIEVCAHVIVGLPGEGLADILNTMDFVSALPVSGIKFHQLQVIKGTRLEEDWRRGEVKTLSLEEYADMVVKCLERLPPEMIIHRLCGDVPRRLLLAPVWGVNKFMIIDKIEGLLRERRTRQGALYIPAGA